MPDELKLLGLRLIRTLSKDQVSQDDLAGLRKIANVGSSIEKAITVTQEINKEVGAFLDEARKIFDQITIEDTDELHSFRCNALKEIRDRLTRFIQETTETIGNITSKPDEDLPPSQLELIKEKILTYLTTAELTVNKDILSFDYIYDNLIDYMNDLCSQEPRLSSHDPSANDDEKSSGIIIALTKATDILTNMSRGVYGPLYLHPDADDQQVKSSFQKIKDITNALDKVIRHPSFYRQCGRGSEFFNRTISQFLRAVKEAECKQKSEFHNSVIKQKSTKQLGVYIRSLRNELARVIKAQDENQEGYVEAQTNRDLYDKNDTRTGDQYYTDRLDYIKSKIDEQEKLITRLKEEIEYYEQYFNLKGQHEYLKGIISAQSKRYELLHQRLPKTSLEELFSSSKLEGEIRLIKWESNGCMEWIPDGDSSEWFGQLPFLAAQAHERIPENQQEFIYKVLAHGVFNRAKILEESDLRRIVNELMTVLNVRFKLDGGSEKVGKIIDYLTQKTTVQAQGDTWYAVVIQRINEIDRMRLCLTDLEMPQLEILLCNEEARRCLIKLTSKASVLDQSTTLSSPTPLSNNIPTGKTIDDINFLLTFLSKDNDGAHKQLNDMLVNLLDAGILDGAMLHNLIFSKTGVEQQNEARDTFYKVLPHLSNSLFVLNSPYTTVRKKLPDLESLFLKRNVKFSKELLGFMMDHMQFLSFLESKAYEVDLVNDDKYHPLVRQLVSIAEYDGQLLQRFLRPVAEALNLDLKKVLESFFVFIWKVTDSTTIRSCRGLRLISSPIQLVENAFCLCIQEQISLAGNKSGDESSSDGGHIGQLALPDFTTQSFKVKEKPGLNQTLAEYPGILCAMIAFLYLSPAKNDTVKQLKGLLKSHCSTALESFSKDELSIAVSSMPRLQKSIPDDFVSYSLIMLSKQTGISVDDTLIQSLISCACRPPRNMTHAVPLLDLVASTAPESSDASVLDATASVATASGTAFADASPHDPSVNKNLLRSLVELAIKTKPDQSGSQSEISKLTYQLIKKLVKDGAVRLTEEGRRFLERESNGGKKYSYSTPRSHNYAKELMGILKKPSPQIAEPCDSEASLEPNGFGDGPSKKKMG